MSNADDTLQIARRLVNENTQIISVIGARVIVLTTFLDAVLPYLTTSQSVMIGNSFRQGMDQVLSLTDDVRVPPEHQAALLEMTGSILEALKGK